jgi:hypothetical protein
LNIYFFSSFSQNIPAPNMGTGELELVRSGLDDTIHIAYQQMSER